MPTIVAYHRPQNLDEAADLLTNPTRRPLGGGTVLVPESRQVKADGVELVDLQELGLDQITAGDRLHLGAMVRLGELADAPELIAELARRELPNTVRNQATVGGTIAVADPDSLLLAGLLVHDAVVEIHGHDPVGLADLLAEIVADGLGQRLITGVSIEVGGQGRVDVTGRTPADTPIVAAVARRADGEPELRLALTGVASTPVLLPPGGTISGLQPIDDYRGTADYRRHLAAVLATRATAALTHGSQQ